MVLTMLEFIVIVGVPTLWAIYATAMWSNSKGYADTVEEEHNFEASAHNMTKLELQAEQQRRAEVEDKLAHTEKMLYGTERLRKDVMAHDGR